MNMAQATVIDTFGKVLSTCDNPQRIVVVDSITKKPIMVIGGSPKPGDFLDVSIDVCAASNGLCDYANPEHADPECALEIGAQGQYALMVERSELETEFKPNWTPESVASH